METMKTFRMVADTPDGRCAIDIVLRGSPEAIKAATDPVRSFLDFGCGFAGAFVDQGTERDGTYSVGIAHRPQEVK